MTAEVSESVYKKEWQYQEGEYTVTRTTVWSGPGCHNGCGLLMYTKDGKLEKVEGDPNMPFFNGRLCMRCLALPEVVNHPDRLKYPMKRVGARGENKWERITWDEAIDIVCEKANGFIEKYGNKSIVCQGGTGRNTTWHMPVLSYAAFKSPNECGGFLSGDACYTPRMAAMNAMFGATFLADCAQFFEDRYDNPNWTPPETILIWGNNPIVSNADGFMGHWLVDCMRRGSKLIVVDPRLTWMAAKAEHWLQVRPGTDSALALGFLNVIINEELYDKEFVENWTFGFEELKERVQEYPVEKVAEITWVPKEKIIAAARAYAKAKPAMLQWGLAVDHAKHGVATGHALGCLWAITGNVDIPGGNIAVNSGYVQADIRAAVAGQMPKGIKEGRLGDDLYSFRKNTFAGHALPDAVLTTLETQKPYPIKMLFISSSNTFANMGAEAKRVYEAMLKAEFIVVADLFMTPTAMGCADLVLPVAMSPERNALRGWWAPIRTISKICQYEECKSDEEMLLAIGRRMDPERFPWKNDIEMIEYCMNNLSSTKFRGTFKELQEKIYVFEDFEYKKHEKGLLRPDGEPGFNTTTGKVELFMTLFAALELDPLPYFHEPTESPVATPELFEQYPFVLTSGQRSYEFFHSEHRQVKSMREFHPDPICEIHPEDAKEYGINNGDWVYLENSHGKCKMKAKLNPGLLRKVISAEHGWWFPEKEPAAPSLFGVFESNINLLTTQCDVGPTGYGAPYKNQICKVYKV